MDVRHLVFNFGSLEVDFRIDGEFRLLGFDFRALGDIMSLGEPIFGLCE